MPRGVQLECTSSEWLMKWAHSLLKESWRWEHRWTGWRCCFLYKESADTYGAEMRWCHKNNDSDNFKAIASSSRLLLRRRRRRRPICMCAPLQPTPFHSRLPQSSPLLRSGAAARTAHMMPFGRVYFFYLHARTLALPFLELAARWKMRGPRNVAPLSGARCLLRFLLYGVFMAPRLYAQQFPWFTNRLIKSPCVACKSAMWGQYVCVLKFPPCRENLLYAQTKYSTAMTKFIQKLRHWLQVKLFLIAQHSLNFNGRMLHTK